MTSTRARTVAVLVAAGASVATLCAAIARVSSVDPVAIAEVAGGVVLAVWLGLTLRRVGAGIRLSAALTSASQPSVLNDVHYRVLRDGGRQAFVAGALRPAIFIGDGLLSTLDAAELAAVLHHEDYHRRTLAPVRAAALEAWLLLVGPWRFGRACVLDRLADLEREADEAALRGGATHQVIARALVKAAEAEYGGAIPFAAASDRRIRWLLEDSAGAATATQPRLPYEWLPVVMLATLTAACHLVLAGPF